MNIAKYIFYLFIISKQFYLGASGSIQLGDGLFLLAFFIGASSKKIKIQKIDLWLLRFVFFVCLINCIYLGLGNEFEFKYILSSSYYIYNFFVVIFFRFNSSDYTFLKNVRLICLFNIVFQSIICLSGLGRNYDAYRYMGTFNDPNQMGFFILTSFFLVVLISRIIKCRIHILFYILTLFLIVKTASTGILLGILIYITIALISYLKERKNIKQKKILCFYMLLFLVLSSFLLQQSLQNFEKSFLYERINNKLSRVDKSDGNMTIWEERGLDRIVKYPQYILYGAGEGEYYRFKRSAHQLEIHSTLPSILFYYGIIPFIILLVWIVKNINKGITWESISIILALFIESFTLLNHRQPFFWMIIVLISIYGLRKKVVRNENTSNHNTF